MSLKRINHPFDTDQSGITLVELIITLAIIGIFTTQVIPFIQDSVEKTRLKGAIEKLYADLQFARNYAITQSKPTYLSFKPQGIRWCYGIDDQANCDCDIPGDCAINGLEKTTTFNEFNGIHLIKAKFGSHQYTAFDPARGTSQAGGLNNGTAWFTSSKGYTAAVIVTRLGRIRICSPKLANYSKKCPQQPK